MLEPNVANAPLRLFVVGATGGIGRALIAQAKERGHGVTAFVRSPEKLGDLAEGIAVRRGDPRDAVQLEGAIGEHDAVISALGPPGIGPSTIQRDGARAIVHAMQARGVRRLLVVSAAMLFEDAGLLAAVVRTTLLRNVARDCAEAERIVESSALDWTIARPPRLTNSPLSRRYAIADGRMPPGASSFMRRADVAHFLLDEAERKEHVRRVVGIAGTDAELAISA